MFVLSIHVYGVGYCVVCLLFAYAWFVCCVVWFALLLMFSLFIIRCVALFGLVVCLLLHDCVV